MAGADSGRGGDSFGWRRSSGGSGRSDDGFGWRRSGDGGRGSDGFGWRKNHFGSAYKDSGVFSTSASFSRKPESEPKSHRIVQLSPCIRHL